MPDRARNVEEKAYRDADRIGDRRNRGGNRGAGSADKRVRDVSKALSRLLRHQALNAGISLDGEGYAGLDKVLSWPPLKSLGVTWSDVQTAVNDNEKQRFSIKPVKPSTDPESQEFSDWLIRANQGHSIKLESDSHLKPVMLNEPDGLPAVAVHGTFCAFWSAIIESGGLKSMGRNHVHFATALPEDFKSGIVSGMRNDAELLVYVDLQATLKDSAMKWWLSDNGVLLTEGDADGLVPLRYFKQVVGRKHGIGTLWADGERVADLPSGTKWVTPYGKGRSQTNSGRRG